MVGLCSGHFDMRSRIDSAMTTVRRNDPHSSSDLPCLRSTFAWPIGRMGTDSGKSDELP